jgi:hypothetical protein
MFRVDVFFDLCRNFVAIFGEGIETRKAVAKYHQYCAVNKAVDQTLESVETDGRIGVVAHAGVGQVAGDGVLRGQGDAPSRHGEPDRARADRSQRPR